MLPADQIEHDIEISRSTSEIVAIVGNDLVGSERSDIIDIECAAGCCYVRTQVTCKLDRKPADRTSAAMHENVHTRTQFHCLDQANPSTDTRVHQRSSVVEADIVRQRDDTFAIAYDDLRVGAGLAVLGDDADASPNHSVIDAGSKLANHARSVTARYLGKRDWK